MNDMWIAAGVVIIWVLLQMVVFPRLGIRT